MELGVREVKPEDLSSVVTLLQQAYGTVARRLGLTEAEYPTYPAFQDARGLAACVKRERLKLYLFSDGEQVIACGGFCPARRDGSAAWLKRIAVLPEQRGKGHGKAVVTFLEEIMRGAGYAKSALLCLTANRELAGFYYHLGYRVTGRSRQGNVRYTRMEKDLR